MNNQKDFDMDPTLEIQALDYQPTEDIFLEEDIIEFDDYPIDYSYDAEGWDS